MKTSYFNRVWFLFVLVSVSCMVLGSGTLFSQYYFKRYIPVNQGEKNAGNCIVNVNVGSNLNVGYHFANSMNSGHSVRVSALSGFLTTPQPRDYNRVPFYDNSNYMLNSLADENVDGSYQTIPPYRPIYKGHPATGTKVELVGSPATLVNKTWTTIIDPSTGNRLWDHVISTNNGDLSVGRQVIVENRTDITEESFYVLSNITNQNNTNRILFSVTKYEWVPGMNGHQVAWSQEYDLQNYNLVAGGIAQLESNPYGPFLTVAGTAYSETGSQRGRIFTIAINKLTGAAISPFHVYEMNEFVSVPHFGGDFVANSITSHPDYSNLDYFDFIISGYVRKDTIYNTDEILDIIINPITGLPETLYVQRHEVYKRPLLFSLETSLLAQNLLPPPYVSQVVAYRYQRGLTNEPIMEGEFNCAKWVQRPDYLDWSIVAVGNIGDVGTYPFEKEALMQKTTTLNINGGGFPYWVDFYGADFTQGMSPVITDAKWFTTYSEYDYITPIFTGYQETNGEKYMVNGSARFSDGYSDCAGSPQQQNVEYYSVKTVNKTPIVSEWGIDDEEPTEESNPELASNSCYGNSESYYIASPKIGEAVPGRTYSNEAVGFAIDNTMAFVNCYSPNNGELEYSIIDLLGTVQISGKSRISAGSSTVSINLEKLLSGSYVILAKCDEYNNSQSFSIIR